MEHEPKPSENSLNVEHTNELMTKVCWKIQRPVLECVVGKVCTEI